MYHPINLWWKSRLAHERPLRLSRQVPSQTERRTSQKINLISIFPCFPSPLCLIVQVLITCRPNTRNRRGSVLSADIYRDNVFINK